MKTFVSSLALVLAATATAHASTAVTGGNIINETWTTAGSPYIVQGDITVPAGSTLTIEAGTQIQLPGGDMQASGLDVQKVEITVRGTLAVNGTAASPVRFDGASSNDWYGIIIDTTATNVVLDHVTIGHAYHGVTYQAPGSVIESQGMRIEDNGYIALQVSDGTPLFDGLVIERNSQYGVYVSATGSLSLVNCVIANGTSGYGVWITNSSGGHTVAISSCTIDNEEYGVYNDSSSTATTVTNSIVTNGYYGIYGVQSVTYSDVWGNTYNYSTAVAGTGCLSANPQFAGPDDYHLLPTSVAIDSGTNGPDHDLENHVRPVDGNGIGGAEWDMGAYEAGSTMTGGGSGSGSGGGSGSGSGSGGGSGSGDSSGSGSGGDGSGTGNPDEGRPNAGCNAGGGTSVIAAFAGLALFFRRRRPR